MEQKNLLLVEDDPVFSDVIGRTLSQRGFELTYAGDSTTAQKKIAEASFDFAILDLNLGDHNSLSLIAPLRDNNNKMKILILTGYASMATAVEAIKLGADNYLAKPADTDEVLSALFASADESPSNSIDMAPMSVKRLEWEHIQKVLNENEGNISKTARKLKMHRRTLQRKLQKRPVSS